MTRTEGGSCLREFIDSITILIKSWLLLHAIYVLISGSPLIHNHHLQTTFEYKYYC